MADIFTDPEKRQDASSTSSVDVWSLLDVGEVFRHLKQRSGDRRDVYISCTASVGLKVRGLKELFEIKVRSQVHPCGAEEWNKVSTGINTITLFDLTVQLVHRRLHVDGEISQAFRQELQRIQKHSLGMTLPDGLPHYIVLVLQTLHQLDLWMKHCLARGPIHQCLYLSTPLRESSMELLWSSLISSCLVRKHPIQIGGQYALKVTHFTSLKKC